jgi:hypothetical protein
MTDEDLEQAFIGAVSGDFHQLDLSQAEAVAENITLSFYYQTLDSRATSQASDD